MSFSSLYRLSGAALLIGGIIAFVARVLDFVTIDLLGPQGVDFPMYGWLAMIVLVGWAFLLPGVFGLYVKQANRGGGFGLFTFILLLLTLIMSVGHSTGEAIFLPGLAVPAVQPLEVKIFVMLRGLIGPISFCLFGISIIRAGVFPRWSGILLALSGLILFNFLRLPKPLVLFIGTSTGLLVFVSFAWCGYLLLSQRLGQAEQTLSAQSSQLETIAPTKTS